MVLPAEIQDKKDTRKMRFVWWTIKLAKFFEKHIKTSDLVEELESFQIPPRALDTPATKTREPFPGITTTC